MLQLLRENWIVLVILVPSAVSSAAYTIETFGKLYGANSHQQASPARLLFALVMGYVATILFFDLIYAMIDRSDHNAFTARMDSFVNANYFSVVAISSTGFGDIVPASDLAKMAVSAEIVVGYLFSMILFSSFAGLAFRKATPR